MINLGIKRILAGAIVACTFIFIIHYWLGHDIITLDKNVETIDFDSKAEDHVGSLLRLLSELRPDSITFSVNDLRRNHFDVNEIISGQLRLDEKMTTACLGYNAVRIKPVRDYKNMIEDNKGFGVITFYYSKMRDVKTGQTLRIVEKISFSKEYLKLLCQEPADKQVENGQVRPIYDEPSGEDYQEWAKFAVGSFDRFKTIIVEELAVKKQYNPVYTETELMSLESFSIVRLMNLKLIMSVEEAYNYKSELPILAWDMHLCALGGAMPFHRYIHQTHYWYFLYRSLRMKLIGLTTLTVLLWSLWNTACREVTLIVREELYRLGVTMNRRMVWRIVLSNWRLFLFPASDAKMRPIIAKACAAVSRRQKDRALREQADEVLTQCRDLPDCQSLESDYGIASGKTAEKDFIKRRQALMRLLHGERELRCSPRWTTMSDMKPETPKPKRQRPVQSNRDKSLDLVREMIPEGVAVSLDPLSVPKLDRLATVMTAIRRWHPQAIKTLLERDDLISLLLESSLLSAIETGDRQIALKELGLIPKQVSRPMEVTVEEHREMLCGISVVIIGTGKAESKQGELVSAVLRRLGADECRFEPAYSHGKIRGAASSGKNLIVQIASWNRHDTTAILDKAGVGYLRVTKIGEEAFLRQIIVQYHKTLSK